MIGLVLVTHTPLGAAMREVARHVFGDDAARDIAVHDILPADKPEARMPAVLADVLRADAGAGVLLLTDLIGATPSNIAKQAATAAQTSHVQCSILAGLNAPMLLRAWSYRHLSLTEVCEKALTGAEQGCQRIF